MTISNLLRASAISIGDGIVLWKNGQRLGINTFEVLSVHESIVTIGDSQNGVTIEFNISDILEIGVTRYFTINSYYITISKYNLIKGTV